MSSLHDVLLKDKYKDLVGLSYFNTISTNTNLNNPVSITSNLNISGNAYIKNIIYNSDLSILGSSLLNNVNINKSINVSSTSLFYNNITINNILNSNIVTVNNSVTSTNSLNILGNNIIGNT